ncbi:MAG TPA: TonB-dependent receptor [Bacteroidales bacterium]|nr:TonB-dependent receptor [Bacteroidales bacterium]
MRFVFPGHPWKEYICNFMVRAILSAFLLVLFLDNCHSQEHILQGTISDRATGRFLINASVLERSSQRGTIADNAGVFRIVLREGKQELVFSHLGYHVLDTVIFISGNAEISVSLLPAEVSLGEVMISSDGIDDRVTSNRMGVFRLTNKEIMKMPALMGETDPLGLIRLTPGVQSGSEGNVGFIVRGGGVDQNLVLFDEAQVYNPGHILGFLSVFNPETVSDVNIIKSGIPAKYGGKLSSVITVNSFKGKNDSTEIKGSVGLISTRVTVTGPLLNGKSSFLIGARKTYLELFVLPLVSGLVKNKTFFNKDNYYNFGDLNAGLNFHLSERDILSLSAYYGRDSFKMLQREVNQDIGLKWGNSLGSVQWNHRFRNRSILKTSLSRSEYVFDLSGFQNEYSFGLFSSVEDYNLKSVFDLKLLTHKLSFGMEVTEHKFLPNKINAKASKFLLNFGQFNSLSGLEGGLFIDDEFPLTQNFSVSAGLRFSFFSHHGPYDRLITNSLDQVTDTVHYSWNKSLAFFDNVEPRAVAKYQINANSSVKASYMRIAQYIHLASSSSATLPTDIWIPSTSEIRPQMGNQVSLGYFSKIHDGNYELSAEVFYKKMDNKLEFLRGIVYNSIFGTLSDNLVEGMAQSYGLELFLRKSRGELNGWISYTLSRTEQKFDEINSGYFYPAKYDRRHDLALTLNWEINQKWNCSGIFIYTSGNAFTIPVGRYIIQGNIVNQYGDINQFRMPPYHRLDLSATRKIIINKKWPSELIFSVYNVYNRANPYFLYFQATGDLENYSLKIKALQVSFFPVIPSVSWNFMF